MPSDYLHLIRQL